MQGQKEMDKISPCGYICAYMPVSVRRHNLARLRDELNITQATLADWVGRTQATIKAIEIGKLALSPRLATVLSAVTGVDKGWLLRNDLSETMPPLEPRSGRLAPDEIAYTATLTLCALVLERLCGTLRRLKPGPAKRTALEAMQKLLKSTASPEYKADTISLPSASFSLAVAEYFTSHPEEFDRELVSLLNLEYFLASVHQRARREEVAAQLLAQKEAAKPRRRKAPSQSPELPSPADRRRKPKSS